MLCFLSFPSWFGGGKGVGLAENLELPGFRGWGGGVQKGFEGF